MDGAIAMYVQSFNSPDVNAFLALCALHKFVQHIRPEELDEGGTDGLVQFLFDDDSMLHLFLNLMRRGKASTKVNPKSSPEARLTHARGVMQSIRGAWTSSPVYDYAKIVNVDPLRLKPEDFFGFSDTLFQAGICPVDLQAVCKKAVAMLYHTILENVDEVVESGFNLGTHCRTELADSFAIANVSDALGLTPLEQWYGCLNRILPGESENSSSITQDIYQQLRNS